MNDLTADLLLERATAPGFLAFVALLACMAAARIIELVYAKRLTGQAKARGAAPKPEPIFAVMVFLHVLPFVLGPLEVLLFGRPFSPALFGVSVVALGLLAVGRVWTLRTLGAMWNVRIVEPGAVVTAGPYRFIRHPNYAVVILELIFMPLAHGCFLTLGVLTALNAFVLARRIPAEEAVLFTLPGYADQMGPKKRFLPGLF